MENKAFPRTTVAGLSLSRMIIGTNWSLGWSHTSPAADHQIKRRYHDGASCVPLLESFLNHGVDTIMGMLQQEQVMRDGVKAAEDKTGKGMIVIDTPILNVDDNAAARAEARATVHRSKEAGATICFLHHSCAEQLVNKNKGTMDRLPDYLDMIRQHGMIPGLSAHMPELVQYSDENGYDVETYIQIYNCMGFMMQIEVEGVNSVIWNAKKPVMTIKSMAAGRCTPFVGITFSFTTIRPCDMVTLGAFTPDEVHEDVEIAMAAIEHRHPMLGKRSSPVMSKLLEARR